MLGATRERNWPADAGAAALALASSPEPLARRSIALAVPTISCGACAAAIERSLAPLVGPQLDAPRIDIAKRLVHLLAADSALPAVLERLAAAGHPATVVPGVASVDRRAERGEWLRLGVAWFALMQGMMFTEALYWGEGEMALPVRDAFRWLAFLITSISIAYAGQPFLRGAASELRARRIGMDCLIALSILLAYVVSTIETVRGGAVVYYDAALMFIAFLLTARTIETRAARSARRRIEALSAPLPDSILRWHAGEWVATTLSAVRVGDELRVDAGAPIPVDGVLASEGEVDESSLTGEPHALHRPAGGRVYAGSTAVSVLRVRATQIAAHSTRAELARIAAAALADRPPWLAAGERYAGVFTLAMLTLALGSFLVLALAGNSRAVPTALAVLAASCPCAFALALPAALAAAQSSLASVGLLLKRGRALAALADVRLLCSDKTGTLTAARAAVEGVEVVDPTMSRERALGIAAALERDVVHPLAEAFAPFDIGVQRNDHSFLVGVGPSAIIDGERYALRASRERIALFRGEQRLAEFAIDDPLRIEAAALVEGCKARGIDVALLSGDAPARVARLAAVLGVANAHGGLQPAQKLAWLKAQSRKTVMLGDGLNDAPVLAAAHASVAMGQGAGDAHRAADVVLLGGDVSKVLILIDTSRKLRRIVRQNYAWALGYHALMLPLALLGMMPPWAAAIGMAASSLLVTLNALRLRQVQSPVATRAIVNAASEPSGSPVAMAQAPHRSAESRSDAWAQIGKHAQESA